jgi:hypothetical protein
VSNELKKKCPRRGLPISSLHVPACSFHMGIQVGLDGCEHDTW